MNTIIFEKLPNYGLEIIETISCVFILFCYDMNSISGLGLLLTSPPQSLILDSFACPGS